MKVDIYQIDTDIDYDGVSFKPYDELEDIQGTTEIDSSIYLKVFSGELNANNFDDVFGIINVNRPREFRGRPMKVSDVIAVTDEYETKFYYCDTYEYIEINFEPEETRERVITVVMCQPDKLATIVELDTELRELQEAVGGGFIEAYYPFDEDICIVCNDSGKINGMPLNRAVKEDGKVMEIIAGPFFICDCSKPNFGSLSKEQQDRYMNMFKYPELLFRHGDEIQAIPYNPDKTREKGGER